MSNEKQVYGSFDLGFGAHVSLDPDHYEALIPNAFVVSTSLGKLLPKSGDPNWDLKWKYCKRVTRSLAKHLSEGKLTEKFVKDELVQVQKDLDNDTLTI